MILSFQDITPAQWDTLCIDSMRAIFGSKRDPKLNRISGAVLFVDPEGDPAGFLTYIEQDSETVYWQHGGASPKYLGTHVVMSGFRQLLERELSRYSIIRTKVSASNVRALRLELALGFLICGCSLVDGKLLVELEKRRT